MKHHLFEVEYNLMQNGKLGWNIDSSKMEMSNVNIHYVQSERVFNNP